MSQRCPSCTQWLLNEAKQCPCGWKSAEVTEARRQKYVFKKCANPSCSAMIGWPIGNLQGLATCKWCQANMAHWQQRLEQTA